MKKLSSLLLFFFISPAVNYAQKAYHCKWRDNQPDKLQIPDSYFSSARKGAFSYCFTNDSSDLYLDIKVIESAEQLRILKSGMTLWIDAEGKTRKKTGIRFPIGSDYIMPGRRPEGMQPATPLSMANTIQLIGFGKEGPSRIPANRPEGIRGSVHYDSDGNLIYRLSIPVSEINSLRKDLSKPLSLGIEYCAPPPDITSSRPGMPPGGMGGGMSRIPPGGGGGGGRGGGGRSGGGMPGGGIPGEGGFQGAQPEITPVKIWVKNVILAKEN